ncbi:CTP synthetase [Rhodobacterales bacterium HKCCE2091]|nr:CTP synthetase [Rhodobacterales bacterium HKCCE2091]
MIRLAAFIYGAIASTLAAVGVVVALVAGVTGLVPLLAAAVAGAVAAVPGAWLAARALHGPPQDGR